MNPSAPAPRDLTPEDIAALLALLGVMGLVLAGRKREQ